MTICLHKEFDKLHMHKEGAKRNRVYIFFSLSQRKEARERIKHYIIGVSCSQISLNPLNESVACRHWVWGEGVVVSSGGCMKKRQKDGKKEQQRLEDEIQSEWRDIGSLREGRIKGHQK